MIAHASLLAGPASEAGIAVPDNVDDFDPKVFIRFLIFRNMQMGRPMPRSISHWENAKIVAMIDDDMLSTITGPELEAMGFE